MNTKKIYHIFFFIAFSLILMPAGLYTWTPVLVQADKRDNKTTLTDKEFEKSRVDTIHSDQKLTPEYDEAAVSRTETKREDEDLLVELLEEIGVVSYGIDVFDSSEDLIKFDLGLPYELEFIKELSISFAGNFILGNNDEIFLIDNTDNYLKTFSIDDGSVHEIGEITPVSDDEIWTDMETDLSTGQVYVTTSDGGVNRLYELDHETAELDFVGMFNTGSMNIAFAIDDTGQGYGHDATNNTITLVDLETADYEILGPTDIDANFAQSMTFDAETGKMFMAAYEGQDAAMPGSLREVNTEVGGTELIGPIGPENEANELGFLATPGPEPDPFVSISSSNLIKEHPELQNGKIAPGERAVFEIEMENTTDQVISLRSVIAASNSDEVLLEDDPTEWTAAPIDPGDSFETEISVRPINWPDVDVLEYGFEIEAVIDGEAHEITPNEEFTHELFIPDESQHYDLHEIADELHNGNLNYNDVIVTKYVPFILEGRDGGVAASLSRAYSVVTNIGNTLEQIARGALQAFGIEMTADWLVSEIHCEEVDKYNNFWFAAGIDKSGTVEDIYSNLFFTNDTREYWRSPELGEPVKAIVQVKDVLDCLDEESLFTSISGDVLDVTEQSEAPVLEPFTFITDTLENDNTKFLQLPFQEDPVSELVEMKGIVHQHWEYDGSYYFSLITRNPAPLSSLNHRVILKVEDMTELTVPGSTVHIEGEYVDYFEKYDMRVPRPDHFGRIRAPLMQRAIEVNEINLFSGEIASDIDEEPWFYLQGSPEMTNPVTFKFVQENVADKRLSENQNLFSNLNIHDSDGNHLGFEYDEQGEIVSYKNEIEHAIYTSPLLQEQYVVVNAADADAFDYQLMHKGEGKGKITLISTDTLESDDSQKLQEQPEPDLMEQTLEEDIEIIDGGSSIGHVNIEIQEDGSIKAGELGFTVRTDELNWSLEWQNEPDVEVEVYLGDLSSDFNIDDIDLSSVKFLGELEVHEDDIQIIDEHSSFEGEVLQISLNAGEVLEYLDVDDPGYYPIRVQFQTDDDRLLSNSFYIGLDREIEITSSDPKEETARAQETELHQNYPNPFNPVTNITYELSEQASVRLEVYNVLGQRITTLVEETQSPGTYEVQFDALNLSSGTYIYRLEAGDHVESRQMMFVK